MGLKILILGSGGREHAISWIISKSKREIEKIYVMPGNAGTLSEKNVFNIECDICLLYTSDAADEGLGVDLGGRGII
mgnify:CR=1 FL=1